MAHNFRTHFGLTQERLAAWLGINRTSLALFETGQRNLPLSVGFQYARLSLAAAGLVLREDGTPAPTPPPLPPPTPAASLFEDRLKHCRYQARNQRYALEQMRWRAIPYEARLAALPALRAWTGPTRHPAREESWLDLFESEAVKALSYDCGAGPQALPEAHIAGLEHEAARLEEMLPARPPVA